MEGGQAMEGREEVKDGGRLIGRRGEATERRMEGREAKEAE